ncbi:MAG: radical SAM protein, partial [Armatimonadetes bacterium]|nr:radical SAM protein [Armatimonadota bacterium]
PTSRCTLSCKHCCFYCSPRRPATRAGLSDAVEWLVQLHQTDRVIHIAGGEAMMFYDDLLAVCERANAQGAAPHFIETNATFARNDAVTRDRLMRLRDAGVLGLLISADPYHQRLCPPDNRKRCRDAAVEVFGERNVAAGDHSIEELRDFREIGRDCERVGEWTRRHAPLLSGRAGDELVGFFADRPVEDLTDGMWHGGAGDPSCRLEFDPETMWEIHVDPHGNLQTCCLIVVGNVNETPLPEAMQRGFLGRSPVIDAVYHEGPTGLLRLAVELGYRPRDGYPQKCGLCWEVRKFLRPHFPDVLGPDEVYEPDRGD